MAMTVDEFLLIPNTDRLQEVDEYVNWKKVKAIYMFHKLAIDRGHISIENFNRTTRNYALWQPNQIWYERKRLLSLSSSTRRENKRRKEIYI
jgi:hypothetical protein